MDTGDITFTIQNKFKDDIGQLHMIGKGVLSGSYATNGDLLYLGKMFRQIFDIIPTPLEDSGGYKFQVTDTRWATPKHADEILVEAYWGDNNGGADGPMIEVTATTDLSAVYFQLEIIGLPA